MWTPDIQSVPRVFVVGGGPAGLTAAYLLARQGVPVTLAEAHPSLWGGISRTESYKGYRFDIGGHRFFSKSTEIEALWDEILPEPLLVRPRKSRIYYRGRFFSYPIRATEALLKLGPLEACRCVASYMRYQLVPVKPVVSFQDWVTNAFGKRLFERFFKSYTEKVWGMPCTEISADWAAQRIRGLSLSRAVWHAVAPRVRRDRSIKSLIGQFRYPRFGPGMMWEAAASRVESAGGQLRQGWRVNKLAWTGSAWRASASSIGGQERAYEADHIVSSMPLRELVHMLAPAPPPAVLSAADELRYRDFLTVALIVRDRQLFDDNWIYVHDPSVRVGRIQNFKSWSPEMVPDGSTACYGLEYFCHEGDGLWQLADAQLLNLAAEELTKLSLMHDGDLIDGTVVRQLKAYPVYDGDYEAHLEVIRHYLKTAHPSLHVVGRNGMHKYNNQDHAMMTAILTAENIVAGECRHDPWAVNDDADYGEHASPTVSASLRDVPRRLTMR